MEFKDITVKNFFPMIRQVSLDAFKTEAYLLQPPYQNLDRIDMGFRKMVWENYPTSLPAFRTREDDLDFQILVIESSLGFMNVVILLNREANPDFICFGPLRTSIATASSIQKIMRENHISTKHTDFIRRFYSSLPVVNLEDFIATMRHLVATFVPDIANCPVEHINYSLEKHEIRPDDNRVEKFNADYADAYATHLRECLDAIASGNTAWSTEKMKSLLDFIGNLSTDSIQQIKKETFSLNSIIISRLLETSVHPAYIFQQSSHFEMLIHQTTSKQQLQHIPFEMARKYSMLTKNYTYEEYSLLVRNVVNYIDQHLSAELSLSTLAQEFDKNPSYLSNIFKKEVGETLTNYICKQRMQAAIKFFNTTPLSVAEVAENVGISDFGYFSKMFRKHVGVSPREYKKMLGR